jgi:mannose-6-phosphate isomerase-like protein (cupin superfamily)
LWTEFRTNPSMRGREKTCPGRVAMVVHHRHRGLRHRDDALQHLGDHAHRRVAQCDSTHQACRGGQVRDNREHADRKPWPERLTRCGCAAGCQRALDRHRPAWRAPYNHVPQRGRHSAGGSMDTSPSVEGPNSVGGCNVWFNGADGERQAIRVDSRDTHGAYSVIESVAEPGCAVPTHRHREEEEHFLVISGRYRIAIGTRFSMHRPELAQLSPEKPRTAGGISPRKKAGCWRSSPREGSSKSTTRSKTLQPRRSETSLGLLAATSWDHRSRNDRQEHGGCAPTARQPANIPKSSIATPVETTAAKYSVGRTYPWRPPVGESTSPP